MRLSVQSFTGELPGMLAGSPGAAVKVLSAHYQRHVRHLAARPRAGWLARVWREAPPACDG